MTDSPIRKPPTTPAIPSRTETDNRIRHLETKYDLLKYTLDGWSIWPVLRFPVYSKLEHLSEQNVKLPFFLSRRERSIIAFRDFQRLLTSGKRSIVVLTQSSNRADIENGKYKDIYFDDLLKNYPSYLTIENLVNRHYLIRGKNALIPSDVTTTGVDMLVSTLRRLVKPSRISELSYIFSQCIELELRTIKFPKVEIAAYLEKFYWTRRIYTAIFRRLRPRHLLLVTSYAYHATVAAARGLGIQAIEFQHGIVDRHHPGYSWTDGALTYKSVMPIPDRIFLYGDYWKDDLASRGFWGNTLESVGSLRMDQYRSVEHPPQTKPEVCLVVTTQNLDIPKIINFFSDFIQSVTQEFSYHIYIKMHPGENDKSRYQAAFQDNPKVTVLLGSEDPSTFALLSRADFHISIYSTCHYEALALGVPTIILPFINHQTMMHLIDTGYASIVHTPMDLKECILQNRGTRVPASVGDRFFKPNALKNINERINI